MGKHDRYLGRGYCPECEEEVDIVRADNGFDHEFGTVHIWVQECAKCGEEYRGEIDYAST